MGKCKNHEGGLHHHLRQRAVFCLQLSAGDPGNLYRDRPRSGVTILSALSMVPGAPGWLAVTGIIVAVVAMSKSFLGTYFGVIEGASEIVKSSLGLLGVRKSRAFNRAMSILLVSAFTFAVCFINPNAISMIYAISGPLIAMILFIMPTLSTWLIPALKPYRSVGNAITLVVGLLCVSVMFFG